MTDNDFDRVASFLYELAQLNITLKKGDFYNKQYEEILHNWKNKELENIFKTSGNNINNPFRKKKNNPNWFKFRKYPGPPYNLAGVHTGETRYALIRGFKVGNKVDIFKRISKNRLQYGYKAKYNKKDITEFINVNIGFSKEFIKDEAERIADVIIEMIDNIKQRFSK